MKGLKSAHKYLKGSRDDLWVYRHEEKTKWSGHIQICTKKIKINAQGYFFGSVNNSMNLASIWCDDFRLLFDREPPENGMCVQFKTLTKINRSKQ